MPIALGSVQFDNENYHEVLVNRSHTQPGPSRNFEDAYFIADAYGIIRVKPGLILAINAANKYVPWNSAAAYGVGSDSAVALLDVLVDLTYGEQPISGVSQAHAIEALCYVWGGNMGTIPAAVKTQLKLIEWR
jgi:hypothetical protein